MVPYYFYPINHFKFLIMKKQILLGLLLMFNLQIFAQEQLGPASFTVPDGWEITKTESTVTLKKAVKKGLECTITISLAQKGAVTTVPSFLAYRKQYSYPAVNYLTGKGSVAKYEANGLSSFFSKGTVNVGMIKAQNYFYSLSNGSQTLHYQLLTSDNSCVEEFNQFMSTLTMETKDSNNAPANARARKAAPAAPAAPAPMM